MSRPFLTVQVTLDGRVLVEQKHEWIELPTPAETDALLALLAEARQTQVAIVGAPTAGTVVLT